MSLQSIDQPHSVIKPEKQKKKTQQITSESGAQTKVPILTLFVHVSLIFSNMYTQIQDRCD